MVGLRSDEPLPSKLLVAPAAEVLAAEEVRVEAAVGAWGDLRAAAVDGQEEVVTATVVVTVVATVAVTATAREAPTAPAMA